MRRATILTTVFGGSAVLLGFVLGITLGAAYCGGSVLYAQEKPAVVNQNPAATSPASTPKAPELVLVPDDALKALNEAQTEVMIAQRLVAIATKEADSANATFQRVWASIQQPDKVITRDGSGKLVYAPKPPEVKK